jgi:uncharacterized RDD family membrane protein YckC
VTLLTRNSPPTRFFSRPAPAWPVLLAIAILSLPARQAPAQQARPTAQRQALIAATEDRLWTARVESGSTFLSYRDRTGQPVVADPFNARIVALAAAGRQAYAFQQDGSFYRYADGWIPALDLPARRVPLDLTALDGVPYALIDSKLAAELPAYSSGASRGVPAEPATTSAPLTLVRYDQRGWTVVAPCPADVAADGPQPLRPRLCAAPSGLMLFSYSPQQGRLNCWTRDPPTKEWVPGPSAAAPALKGFWPAIVNRLPTLVLNIADSGADTLSFLRLVGERADRAWESASLDLSPLPATPAGTPTTTRGKSTPVDAGGFNQHLGLQVQLADGSTYLRFGRFEGPATLSTLDLLASPPQNVLPAILQALRAAVVLGVFVSLFVFRRGSLVTPFPLARGLTPASVLPRLAAAMIDLLPFTVLAALLLQLSWLRALNETARMVSDSQGIDRLPPAIIVSWMLLSAGAYATYCAIMELLAGRTVGKMLFGLHVVAAQGERPPAWRVVLRNVFRVIEVLPPFWILVLIVLLSRNRQRVGDIFARTIVVRQVAMQPDSRQE